MARQRGERRTRVGIVVSDKMQKTRVVAVRWSQPHPLYQRRVRRLTKFKVHDAENATRTGDTVRIVETRPLSKDKRWRIIEVVARGEQVEVRPEEIGETLLEELERRPAAAPESPAAPAPETPAAEAQGPEPAAQAGPAAETAEASQPEGAASQAVAEVDAGVDAGQEEKQSQEAGEGDAAQEDAAAAEGEAVAQEEGEEPERQPEGGDEESQR